MEKVTIICTTSDQQTVLRQLAERLVTDRLVACAQIGSPIESTYIWNEKLESVKEWTLTLKTRQSLKRRVMDVIEAHHNYQVPEVLVFQADDASESYTQWLLQQANPDCQVASLSAQDASPAGWPEVDKLPTWHLFLHGMYSPPITSESTYLDKQWPTLEIDPASLRKPLPTTFEAFCQRLNEELGAYCEPDGAFGWHPQFSCSDPGAGDSVSSDRTAVTGTVHCADQRVLGVEMFAQLRSEDWRRFLALFRDVPFVVVQLVEAGIFVSPAILESMISESQSERDG